MPGNPRRFTTFVLIAMLVALGAFATTAYVVWRLRAKTVDQQLATAALTARALEDHLTQSFNIIERTLLNVAEEYRAADDLAIALRQAPYLRSVALLGKSEQVVASSTAGNVGVRLTRADFLPQTAAPVEVLRIGLPQEGRDLYDARPIALDRTIPGVSFIPVARDVRVAGDGWTTVVAAVNADYFLNFYSNHLAAGEGLVQLLRYDGRLLLSTDESERPGTPGGSEQVLAHMAEREAGQFQAVAENGRAVLTAYRVSLAYPFVLVVRLDQERALAGWREEAINAFGIVGAILLAALAVAALYYARFERISRAQALDQQRLRIAATAFESQIGLLVTNADAVILQVNRAFTDITGYATDEAVGQDMSFLQSGQHAAACYAAMLASVESSGAYAGEIVNRHKDGTLHPHFLRITAVHGDDGRVSNYVGALTDISERKLAEESLLTLSRAVEQSRACIVITDPDANIKYVNPIFEETTGYTFAEVVGKNPRILGAGERSAAEYAEMWAVLMAGNTWHGEFHNRRKDGTLFWELASISPVHNEDGELVHFVAVKEDITARKQAEQEIGELNRDFVSFLENTTDFIYFKDGNSRFRFCSQALARVTGYASWRDMVGKRDRDVFPADIAQIHHEDEWQIVRQGRPLLNRIEAYQDADGNPGWISTNKWPLTDHDGTVTGMFAISRDITRSMAYESELQQAKLSAEAANIAKSRFLAAMSHEIRTPMNGILGMAQMLLMPNTTAGERTDYARTILTSGRTLLALLNDILDLSKIEAGKIELENTVFAPAQLVRETQALFAGSARDKGLELRAHWRAAPTQRYRSDVHRLRQMLSNLVGNAIKFTAQGGVRIEGSEVERLGDSALLEFSVSDTGIGIPAEKIDLLFKPFSQADSSTTREFGGTGLGLSIVNSLAKLIGGDVGVDSVPGKGSRFWFRVRVEVVGAGVDRAVVVDAGDDRAAAAMARPLRRGHVLVAEDNAVNRLVIEAMLGKLGHRVSVKENGQEAVGAILNDEHFDLVLMDLSMPVLDGCGATEQIRRWEAENQRPRLPIIAFTAGAFDEDRVRSLAAGMDDFLTKPVNRDALQGLLDKWLRPPPA